MVSRFFLTCFAFTQLSCLVMAEPAFHLGDVPRSMATNFRKKFDLFGFAKSFHEKALVPTLCVKDRGCMTKVANLLWTDALGFEYNQRPTKKEFDEAIDKYAAQKYELPLKREALASQLKSTFRPFEGHVTMTAFRDQLYGLKFNFELAMEKLSKVVKAPQELLSKIKSYFTQGTCPLKQEGTEAPTLKMNGFELPTDCKSINGVFISDISEGEGAQGFSLKKRSWKSDAVKADTVIAAIVLMAALLVAIISEGTLIPAITGLFVTTAILLLPHFIFTLIFLVATFKVLAS